MNAQLKPIESCAAVRPAYDNDRVCRGGEWISANWQALRGYWFALGGTDVTGEEFLRFCTCQWDRQRMGF